MNGYNFTERVRKVLAMSREEAFRLKHEYVGTEHILLGLIAEGEGVAAAVLQSVDIDLQEIRETVEKTVNRGKGGREVGPDLPYTSRAKKVLELAMAEARELNHSYVGTEHLLLGLLREEKGIAAQVLRDQGLDIEAARVETLRLLGTEVPPAGRLGDRARGQPGDTGETFAGAHSPERLRLEKALSRSTPRLQVVLLEAVETASRRSRGEVQTEDLLEALVADSDGMAAAILERVGVDRQGLHGHAAAATRKLEPADEPGRPAAFSSLALDAFRHAGREARAGSAMLVGTDHMLIGLLLTSDGSAADVLKSAGVTLAAAREARDRLIG